MLEFKKINDSIATLKRRYPQSKQKSETKNFMESIVKKDFNTKFDYSEKNIKIKLKIKLKPLLKLKFNTFKMMHLPIFKLDFAKASKTKLEKELFAAQKSLKSELLHDVSAKKLLKIPPLLLLVQSQASASFSLLK